jgi:hypothetical protein
VQTARADVLGALVDDRGEVGDLINGVVGKGELDALRP